MRHMFTSRLLGGLVSFDGGSFFFRGQVAPKVLQPRLRLELQSAVRTATYERWGTGPTTQGLPRRGCRRNGKAPQ